MSESDFPQTFHDAVKYFADPDRARNFMVSMRWPSGVHCPRCDSDKVGFISTRKLWECKACKVKKQFTVKVGTLMEDSPIALEKWLCAIWLMCNSKNGISSHEIGRHLGVTQKSAWFMMHRIRLALQNGSFDKLKGEVEVDETFIGGKARFMHKGQRKAKGTGPVAMTAVQGLLERHGKGSRVIAKVMKNRRKVEAQKNVFEYVLKGSEVFTDALPSYNGLKGHYLHEVVDHAEKYVDGKVHTNGLENFWSLFKRCVKGTYVSLEPFHLFRYLDEQTFRFNERKDTDAERFIKAAQGMIGKKLCYSELTGKAGRGMIFT